MKKIQKIEPYIHFIDDGKTQGATPKFDIKKLAAKVNEIIEELNKLGGGQE